MLSGRDRGWSLKGGTGVWLALPVLFVLLSVSVRFPPVPHVELDKHMGNNRVLNEQMSRKLKAQENRSFQSQDLRHYSEQEGTKVHLPRTGGSPLFLSHAPAAGPEPLRATTGCFFSAARSKSLFIPESTV